MSDVAGNWRETKVSLFCENCDHDHAEEDQTTRWQTCISGDCEQLMMAVGNSAFKC